MSRPGVQHSALETELNLERVLPMAAKLTPLPLLFRADSGLCSLKIMQEVSAQAQSLSREIAFIIKWNPRRAPVEAIATERVQDANTTWCHLREGKRMCLWTQPLKLDGVGTDAKPARRVLRLVERTIDKHGNPLLLPAYELEGWTTTLPAQFTMQDIIDLYKDHATHEQFGKTPSQHSEFKTDMDLERLPSGKFDTNFLVCSLAAVAMNILRLIGQNALIGKDAPLRHAAKRRRMKTGGSGSIESSAADPAVTEVTAGSGLFVPTLFDGYRAFAPRPAAYFGLDVVRVPAPGYATAFGGGYVASGPSTRSRLPRPVEPRGLALTGREGAGEVQTPLHGPGADKLDVGDRVWFRHAKAGEVMERFDAVHLVRGAVVERTVPTYRGEGRTFG